MQGNVNIAALHGTVRWGRLGSSEVCPFPLGAH